MCELNHLSDVLPLEFRWGSISLKNCTHVQLNNKRYRFEAILKSWWAWYSTSSFNPVTLVSRFFIIMLLLLHRWLYCCVSLYFFHPRERMYDQAINIHETGSACFWIITSHPDFLPDHQNHIVPSHITTALPVLVRKIRHRHNQT